MTAFTLEDLAATSDDAAVRRRFDARNFAWFRVLHIFILLAALGLTGGRLAPPTSFLAVFSGVSVLLAVTILIITRDRPAALNRWVRQHVSATILTVLLAHYVLLISATGRDWPAWTFIFPVLALPLRLLVSEAVLLHSAYWVIAAAVGIFAGGKDVPQTIIGIAFLNAAMLTVELIAARRLRREIVGDWSDRRRHAQEQLRMRDELRYARAIQLSMLPESAPQLEWVDVAGVSRPATEVGGDYFDYFVIGDRLAIVSGDVAGHGLASGLVLAAMRSGFTLLRDALVDPSAVLRRLHDLIAETTRRRTLVTCAVLLLDREAKRATFASAGHPPAVARRDGTVTSIELFAPPLGVKLPLTIPQRDMPFAAGDVFVLHTDGVYETVNALGESYGMERIEEVVRACDPGASAADVRDDLVRDVERFRGAGAQVDDITVVVARIL
jgi:Stage II sporulation protein E (SpoIIE)